MIHIPTIEKNPVKPIPLGCKVVGSNEYGTIMEKMPNSDINVCHCCKYSDLERHCSCPTGSLSCSIDLGHDKYYK